MPSVKGTAVALAAFLPLALGLYKNGSMIAPCDSEIYCHGDMLKQIQLAKPFTDSKTFVDMPAKKSAAEIKDAFDKLPKPLSNNTALQDFLAENFDDAGGELQRVPRDQLKADPQFLNKIKNTDIKEFVLKVIDIWPELTRTYVGSNTTCQDCPNSFIPINRTFVVAGGRFREPYYWDSYWIIEGLLRTGGSYVKIAKNMIENFLDLIWIHGFVPNGTRIYYLNRSQPPLLAQMVKLYIEHTKDESILPRAVPLLIKEHFWWTRHRSIGTPKNKLPFISQHYDVENTEPRPESYREDYETATNKTYYSESGQTYPATHDLNATEIATLYANLASGAESGLDYSVSKWAKDPTDAMRGDYFPLRSLDTHKIIPVDLNAIMYANEVVIADLLHRIGRDYESGVFHNKSSERKFDIATLFWNPKFHRFFDHNLTSAEQHVFIPRDNDTKPWDTKGAPKDKQVLFSVTQYYPFWLRAAPKKILDDPKTLENFMFPVQEYLYETRGGIPSSNLKTGQQWDQPNVWPPHMHILMKTLVQIPLPEQPTEQQRRTWLKLQDLAVKLGQRYLDSTFCTWYATGGSTSNFPQLPSFTEKDKGIMFEKYDDNSTNHAGGGGEYEVVEGFGWTNGVLMWVVDTFGNKLKMPRCGNITAAKTHSDSKRGLTALHLSKIDAQRIKKF